jgi:hypothetical protein
MKNIGVYPGKNVLGKKSGLFHVVGKSLKKDNPYPHKNYFIIKGLQAFNSCKKN